MRDLLHNGFRYALSLTHHQAQAEDILQEAWLAVLKANGPHNKAYLYTAIRTRYYNHCKRERLVSMTPLDEFYVSESELSAEDTIIFEQVEDEDLSRALASLRAIEREVLVLAAVDEFTAAEIAELTGHPRGTILSLLFRARSKVRKWFDQHAPEVRHER